MDTTPSTAAEGDEPSARADLVASALWITFGAAVAIGAWRMDRLERLSINPYEAPGLVPGLLGALIVLLGLALAGRSVRRGALRPASALAEGTPAAPTADTQALRHMAAVFGLTLFYALALIGTGLPFWLATFAFITVFVGLLDRERQARLGRSPAAQWLRASIYGAVWSAIVTLSFQHIFLVRLP
ncbi:MAG: tripartite tricarboxylate transporter TctB family protein, partial [Rubrivivax sp.]